MPKCTGLLYCNKFYVRSFSGMEKLINTCTQTVVHHLRSTLKCEAESAQMNSVIATVRQTGSVGYVPYQHKHRETDFESVRVALATRSRALYTCSDALNNDANGTLRISSESINTIETLGLWILSVKSSFKKTTSILHSSD